MKHSAYYCVKKYQTRHGLTDSEMNLEKIKVLKQLYGDKDVEHIRTDSDGASRALCSHELD